MKNKRIVEFDYTIKSNGKFLLKDILTDEHYDVMVVEKRITVLNKMACGNGGTTGIINYIKRKNKGCLILVPNVSIVKSKEKEYKNDPDVCCVYGGVSDINYSAKIVIATYDQFKRLLSNLTETGLTGDFMDDVYKQEFWAGRAIFVDEYHKLIDDQFREIRVELTEMIINTSSSITLFSATPHNEFVNNLKDAVNGVKDVVTFNIDYNRNHLVRNITVYEMGQSKLVRLLKSYIDREDKYCIFINNVSKVASALNQIGTDECEILCSEDSKEEADRYYSSEYNKKKRVHFLTSAYFTGHDISDKVRKVVIIGGRSSVAMAISMRDIQQIIGRFREYCNADMRNIVLVYLKERKNNISYENVYKPLTDTNDKLNVMGEDWSLNKGCIKTKLDNLYYMDAKERLGYWATDTKLIKRLRKEGYILSTHIEKGKMVDKAIPVDELPEYDSEEKLTYKEAYERIVRGEYVSWDEYRYAPKIKEYIDIYGVPKEMPSRDEILNVLKIGSKVSKKEEINRVSLTTMTPEERYEIFEFKDAYTYKASYLMCHIKYIKENYPELLSESISLTKGDKLLYELLPFYMKEVFGCLALREKSGSKKKNIKVGSQDEYVVYGYQSLKELNFTESVTFGVNFGNFRIYEKFPKKSKKVTEKVNTIKISIKTEYKDGNYWGKTIKWNDIKAYMGELDVPLYNWVNENKAERLKEVKDSETWSYIKNKMQLMISEFYNDTELEYRHIKSDVDTIGSLIIDIDNSISFYQFKKIYSHWSWLAYPTLSNTTPKSWTKFRVIVPLAHPIKLKGDNNLRVLKALRSYFCPFEDACHNLGSYVNPHDFDNRYVNKGEVFRIEQSDVDVFQHIFKIRGSYVDKKINKDEIASIATTAVGKDKIIERTIKKFEECCEGSRDNTVYAQLMYLESIGFSSDDVERIRAGISPMRSDMKVIMDDVIRRHREWGF